MPFCFLVFLFALKRIFFIQRKHFKIKFCFQPPAVYPHGFKQHHQHDQQSEHCRFKTGLMLKIYRQVVFGHDDDLRKKYKKGGPENSAMQTTETPDDNHGQKLYGKKNSITFRIDEKEFVSVQTACNSGKKGTDGKCNGFKLGQIDSHGLSRHFAVANRNHGPAGGRAQKIAGGKQR